MQASHQRHIRSGERYDALIPRATGKRITIKRRASLEHTLHLIPKVVEVTAWQMAKIAPLLKSGSIRDTARMVWEFCYHHFQYRPDRENVEEIRSPQRSWADRRQGIDCDCFTVLISSLLSNLGIPHALRCTKYPDPKGLNPDPPFSHIYVVVPDGTGHHAIDPVTDQFDFEAPYLNKIDIPMTLQFLNGLEAGNSPPQAVGGVDFHDLFGDDTVAGLGRRAKPKTPPSPTFVRPPRDAKERIAYQKAKSSGQIPQSMSFEGWKAWLRQQFIQKHGMTPEAWKAKLRAQLQAGQQAGQAAAAASLERLRAEARRRGIGFDPNADRDTLIALLNDNPPPKIGGRILNAVNTVNPATVLLRTGILIGLKTNMLKISQKLRYGFLTNGQARAKRVKPDSHKQLVAINQKLRGIFYKSGGKPENYKKAILAGKGNTDRDVTLSGLHSAHLGYVYDLSNATVEDILGPELTDYETRDQLNGLAGLGEPVSASAAVAAAMGVLGTIAGLLKMVKEIKEGQISDDPIETVRPTGSDAFSSGMDLDLMTAAGDNSIDLFESGNTGSNKQEGDPAKTKGIGQWVKDNPLLAGVIVVGVAAGGYLIYKKATQASALNGPPQKDVQFLNEAQTSSSLNGSSDLWKIPPRPAGPFKKKGHERKTETSSRPRVKKAAPKSKPARKRLATAT